jgi:hypothetical protein
MTKQEFLEQQAHIQAVIERMCRYDIIPCYAVEDEQECTVEPYLGQRCAAFADPEHWNMHGFGTIVKIREDQGKTWVRVELDARGSSWFELADVELLATYPAV